MVLFCSDTDISHLQICQLFKLVIVERNDCIDYIYITFWWLGSFEYLYRAEALVFQLCHGQGCLPCLC